MQTDFMGQMRRRMGVALNPVACSFPPSSSRHLDTEQGGFRRPRRWRGAWLAFFVFALGVFLYPASVVGQEAGGIRILDFRVGSGDTVPDHGWVSGVAELSFTPLTPSDTRRVHLDVTLIDRASLRVTGIRMPADLAGEGVWRFPFYLPIPGGDGGIQAAVLEVVDARGRMIARSNRPLQTFRLGSGGKVAYIGSQLAPLFTVESRAGMGRMGGMGLVQVAPTTGVPWRVVDLPRHFAGYTGIAALLWHHPDFDRLEPMQRDALADYIRQGGHLVLVPPLRGHIASASGALPIPGAWGERVESVPLSGALGREGMLWEDPAVPDILPLNRVTGPVPMRAIEARRGRVLLAVEDRPVLLRGQYGAGTVTMLGVDVCAWPLLQTQEAVALLSWALERPLRPEQLASLEGESLRDQRRSRQSAVVGGDPTHRFDQNVLRVFDVRPIRSRWVFLFTLSYAVCAGPLLFVILWWKRRLGWTAPLLAGCGACFTVFLYLMTFWVKGSSAETMEYGIVDATPDGRGVRRTIGALFSIRPGMVRMEGGEGSITGRLHPAPGSGGGTQEDPPQGLALDPQSRYVPFGEGVAPEGVRLHQWSLAWFSVHQPVEGLDPLPALEIRITNPGEAGGSDGGRGGQRSSDANPHPGAEIRRVGGGSFVLPATLLVTAEGGFVFPATPPEGTDHLRVTGVSLVHLLRGTLGSGRHDIRRLLGSDDMEREEEPGILTWADAIQLSFPRLIHEYQPFQQTRARSDDPETLEWFLRMVTPTPTIPGPRLTPWQILSVTTEPLDRFQFDITRVLVEGGGVLLRIDPSVLGVFEPEGVNPDRRGYTLRRDVIAPERIHRGGAGGDGED